MAPVEKASLLCSQFDSKQCREQFVTPFSCFSQSRCNSFGFRTPALLRLLLDLDTYGGVDPLLVFPLFLKIAADIFPPKLCIIVSGVQQGVCWVLSWSSIIPVKCLSWWRTDYTPMLMTPHYWQLFASQQTDLLLQPLLTGTWLGFRN